jgi:hypothetical protein
VSRIAKITIGAVIAFIIVVYGLTKMVTAPFKSFAKNYIEQEDLMESHVGDTIIMRKDTLIVVDFSVISDTYTLDNGMTINRKIIENVEETE